MLLAFSVFSQSTHTIDFETPGVGAEWDWTVGENADNPPLEFVANPLAGGINTSATAAKFTARFTGNPWALCYTNDDGEFTFDAANSTVTMMVYKPVISNVGFKVEGSTGSPLELVVANTLINTWEELTFDFSAVEGQSFNRLVIIPDFDFTPRAQENIVYFDNIQVPDGVVVGPLPEPTTVPPTPPHAAADVISIYSEAYTNIPGTDFNPNWGQSTAVTINYVAAGNNTLKYENLNYQGTQYTSQDVSIYEYLHVDFWTPNATDLNFFLISPGAETSVSLLPFATETWVSVDIPLSDFVPPVNLSNVFQFKVTGNQVVYFDNWYFWKTPPPPGSDASLSDLKVDGNTVAGFLPTTLTYNIDLPYGTTTVPTVTATTNDPSATFVVNNAASLPGTTEVVVTAQDLVTMLTYYVNFTVLGPEPSTVPLTPPHAAEDVISIYSDTYDNVPGTNYNPWWGQATIVTVDYVAAGNNTLRYENLNYQGTEYTSQDVSGYENLHVDFWTANSTNLSIYLISPGPVEVAYALPVSLESWVSVDIALSAFAPVNLSDVFQFKVVGDGDVFFDNLYFWKTPVSATTSWNGSIDNNWHDAGNWSNGIPGAGTNVTIPSGLSNYPTIGAAAVCNDITLVSDANGTATLVDDGYLTVNGTATAQRYYPTGGTTFNEWHLISSPVSNAQAGVYTGYYVQWYEEAMNQWHDIVSVSDPLTSLQGFAFFAPTDGMSFDYIGTLGNGTFALPIAASGSVPEHWNLFGNPYPSPLDWDLVAAANLTNLQSGAVYYLDQATGAYVSYNGGMGGGSRYVPSGQGFFVSGANDMASFTVDNTMRTHTGGSAYYKADFDNLLVLTAEGNGYSDNTYLRFDDQATVGIDKQFDAYKIFGVSNPGLPQLYTVSGSNLSINVLPQTDMLVAGFRAGTNGVYTINASEVNGLSYVILEDLVTGEQIDLLSEDYSFAYTINDPDERFILHFETVSVSENMESQIDIYSQDKKVYVELAGDSEGQISVFNTMGQEILSSSLSDANNVVTLKEAGFYIIKVSVESRIVTEKVLVK